MSFSNIDNRKQIQRKKKNFINIIPSYLLPNTKILKKKKEICLYKTKTKKLLFQLSNPHLEGTLINLYMSEKKFFGSGKGGSP